MRKFLIFVTLILALASCDKNKSEQQAQSPAVDNDATGNTDVCNLCQDASSVTGSEDVTVAASSDTVTASADTGSVD